MRRCRLLKPHWSWQSETRMDVRQQHGATPSSVGLPVGMADSGGVRGLDRGPMEQDAKKYAAVGSGRLRRRFLEKSKKNNEAEGDRGFVVRGLMHRGAVSGLDWSLRVQGIKPVRMEKFRSGIDFLLRGIGWPNTGQMADGNSSWTAQML
jgi:hypothetical protein